MKGLEKANKKRLKGKNNAKHISLGKEFRISVLEFTKKEDVDD